MSNEEAFVNELIGFIFAYPDDDYMTMECLCRKLHKHGLIEKKDGEWTTNFIERKEKDELKICDTCRYYNSNIPCGSTPSACKEADKFAEEFIDGLKKLKPKDEPQIFICPMQDNYEALIEDEPQTERSSE